MAVQKKGTASEEAIRKKLQELAEAYANARGEEKKRLGNELDFLHARLQELEAKRHKKEDTSARERENAFRAKRIWRR